ncbi:MAG: Vitamin B12 import ATP-binding protein BtuD [Candidatus Erwinia impunctatus]|nr:Vitamin B12 import ATP-binding protein BtuD [Culicoides impunctatus]
MPYLHIAEAYFLLNHTRSLVITDLTITSGESWALVGSNGSGKSSLARALSGELHCAKGTCQNDVRHLIRLSLEQLQALVSAEWQRNNTDMLSEGEDESGRTAAEIIQESVHDESRCHMLANPFGISALLSRRFKL